MKNGQTIADLHTHNHHSFDSEMHPDDCFSTAVEAGVDIIAVTNHFDIDGVLDGIYAGYDVETDKSEVLRGQKEYSGRLRIIWGIELGQPTHRQREALEFLERHDFDYVLLSLHNLRDVPDFSFWDYSKMTDEMCEYWLDKYFSQILDMLDFPRCDALAHLTYPYRYMKQAGRKVDFGRFRDKIAAIYEKLIARGAALEVNTSGYRQGMGAPMPDERFLALYRECGGELTVVGSDAHRRNDIGAGIEQAYGLLRRLGYRHTYVPARGGFEPLPL